MALHARTEQVNTAPRTAQAVKAFWRCYRNGQFFEAHEVLEDAWREECGAERERLQGLIHGAVARYQHGRGNAEGAARQLARCRARLERAAGNPAGLLGESAEFLAEVMAAVAPSVAALDGAARERLRRLETQLSDQESSVQADRALEA